MSQQSLDAETRAMLTLHLLPGLGPRLTRALLERFGSAVQVLAASAEELAEVPYLRKDVAERIAVALRQRDLEGELDLLVKHGAWVVHPGLPSYPGALSSIADPPPLLYARGTLTEGDSLAVAVVGSRSCTAYGRRIAERLARGLARAGITVISGLARGIDGAAHQGALAAGGRTIAVLAGGLSRIYPPEHAELAEAVVQSGALLSEAPMAVEPLPQMFPQRNRIISGLARGVVLVEAAERSGALLTAQHAAEQGREVFAVPGPVDCEASAGTLRLLKEGATLVRNVDDILEVLDGLPSLDNAREAGEAPSAAETPEAPAPPLPKLTEQQRCVLEAWHDEPIRHADQLVEGSGLSVTDVGQALVMLEMHGLVRRLPGNRFERSRSWPRAASPGQS